MKLKVGDKVKLNKNAKEFRYGRVMVGYDEIGKIVNICQNGELLVDFPSCFLWNGLEKELVLVNRTKFFKKLPNDFTGTIEVENGYIVEKEILDKTEKEYLANVIKPFRKKVLYIVKMDLNFSYDQYIMIILKNDSITFPVFKKDSMYKGMKGNEKYTLEELGLC